MLHEFHLKQETVPKKTKELRVQKDSSCHNQDLCKRKKSRHIKGKLQDHWTSNKEMILYGTGKKVKSPVNLIN